VAPAQTNPFAMAKYTRCPDTVKTRATPLEEGILPRRGSRRQGTYDSGELLSSSTLQMQTRDRLPVAVFAIVIGHEVGCFDVTHGRKFRARNIIRFAVVQTDAYRTLSD